MKSIKEKLRRDPHFARLFAEEEFVIQVLEEVCQLMKHKNVSRAELARRLGTSRANVTQMLRGRNVSLRTIAAAAHVLGGTTDFQIRDKGWLKKRRETMWLASVPAITSDEQRGETGTEVEAV